MILSFISTSIITRLVTPDSYGQYSIFIIYVNIAMFIFSLGLDQALVRFFYQNENIEFTIQDIAQLVNQT